MGGHHFVLVHGLGHGAWCWFKVSALLQAQGHSVTALDLASCGVHKAPAPSITTLPHYLAPLIRFLAAHSHSQVILVGHSLGGSSISYAMELFPEKVCKAIFVCALMPLSGDAFLPLQFLTPLLDAKALILMNDCNENDKESSEPTSIHTSITEAPKFFYNNCSLEDKVLACSCLNPSPFIMLKEIMTFSSEKYGRIPRFYIKCLEDLTIPASVQDDIVRQNPPLAVFNIEESDHSPFFCFPNALVELLITIANN